MPDNETIIGDEEAAARWREAAEAFGSIPKNVQDLANVDENGEPREGGLSERGRRVAAAMPKLDDLAEKIARQLAGEDDDDKADISVKAHVVSAAELASLLRSMRDRDEGAGGEGVSRAEAVKALRSHPVLLALTGLGFAGPIRAAVAAGARALADGIDGGSSDDREAGTRTGFFKDRMIKGGTTLAVELGREPFVLLRATHATGGVHLSVATGGDNMFDSLTPEQLLLVAADQVATMAEQAAAEGGDLRDCLKGGLYLTATRQSGPRASDADVPVSPAPAGSRGDTPGEKRAGEAGAGDDQGASPRSNSKAPRPSDGAGDAP